MGQIDETFLFLLPITCLLSALRLTDATMLMAIVFVISTSTYHQVCLRGAACDVQLVCDVVALDLLRRWLLVFCFDAEFV